MDKQIQDLFQSQYQNKLQNKLLNFDQNQIYGIKPENTRTVISKASNSLLNQNIQRKNPNRPLKIQNMPKGFFSKQFNAKYSSRGLLFNDVYQYWCNNLNNTFIIISCLNFATFM